MTLRLLAPILAHRVATHLAAVCVVNQTSTTLPRSQMGTTVPAATSRTASGAAHRRRKPLAVVGATEDQQLPGQHPSPEEKDDASHRLSTPSQDG